MSFPAMRRSAYIDSPPSRPAHCHRSVGRPAMPNLNSRKEWSEKDLFDLKSCLCLGESVERIADFLCRDLAEVEAKVRELRGRREN